MEAAYQAGTRTAKRQCNGRRPVAAGAGMTFDGAHGVAVLYGGSPDSSRDVWHCDGTTWSPQLLRDHYGAAPGGRMFPPMVYDASSAGSILFGGSTISDTWQWHGAS